MKRRIPIRNSSGQATVELALIVPVLLLILFAIVQLGLTFHNYLALTDAVRAGARTAAVSRQASDPAAATTARVREAGVNLDESKLSVTVASTWKAGDPVTVTATYPYSVNVIGVVVASGNLTSKMVERVE